MPMGRGRGRVVRRAIRSGAGAMAGLGATAPEGMGPPRSIAADAGSYLREVQKTLCLDSVVAAQSVGVASMRETLQPGKRVTWSRKLFQHGEVRCTLGSRNCRHTGAPKQDS